MSKRLLPLAVLAALACDGAAGTGRDFPVAPGEEGKEDVFGRRLAGIASPYEADPNFDEASLRTNLEKRRAAAWRTTEKVLEEVPLLGLAELDEMNPDLVDGDIPKVPRFETWYGIDDLKRMFQHLYEGLGPNGRAARQAFTDQQLEEAAVWNAHALDRSDRWPLERFFEHVRRLGTCPEGMPDDECAREVLGQTAGAVFGNSRIVYSPQTARHLLKEYPRILACLGELDQAPMAAPEGTDNFTLCFGQELPSDAVLIKAQWVRAEPGVPNFPAFDTSGEALARRLGGTADWGDAGDRKTDPGTEDIYTIRLRDGSTFRLAGLHIMSKEARHWQWITLWWSDKPQEDFGADRPRSIGGIWKNYKMCTATWYTEDDTQATTRFSDAPSLKAALAGVSAAPGAPTWCSNPYVEHGRGNAGTNCIGCHQHGAATLAPGGGKFVLERVIDDETLYPQRGRTQLRSLFPADYLYSYNRVDDFAHVFAGEAGHFERGDEEAVRPRVTEILAKTPNATAGGQTFSQLCAGCHGAAGQGGGFAPSLVERVPMREDESILQTLIAGKGGMPAWGERLNDQQLADLLAHLRERFGKPPE